MIVFSYGGGVQSVAICVLVRDGVLPRPDLILIADTGREVQTTWDYLRDYTAPLLASVGLAVTIVPHTYSRVDLYDSHGLTLLPAWTETGRKMSFCSGEWKRDAQERYMRCLHIEKVTQWIGYSIDEHRRAKQSHRKWCEVDFPLINLFINRAMCGTIIEEAGLPIPYKSRCWCCPHQSGGEWAEVRARPEEWSQAVALERQIQARDPEQSGLYLHRSRVPLPLALLEGPETDPANLCHAASCYT